MAVTEPPFWHLSPAALAPREGFGVLLKDTNPIPPVLPIEVRVQDVPRERGYQASREGARELLHFPRKGHVVHLGLVYYLDDQ